MKIVIISFTFYDYVIQLANRLSKNNDVLVILPDLMSQEYEESIDNKIRFYSFKFPKRLFDPNNLLILFGILNQVRRFKPDVIHLQRTTHIFLMMFLFRKYSIITTIHDIKPHIGDKSFFWKRDGNIYKYIINSTIKNSDQIIVHGTKIKETILTEYNVPEFKVNVVPIGEYDVIPFKKYEKNYIHEEDNSILFFGSIKDYKGLKYLIKAEPLISKAIKNLKIIIAGAGDFQKYMNMINNNENFVIYNHYISDEEAAKLFKKSSFLVLPYIDGSISGVIPLAYAFKKAVVVTEVGSIPEMVDDGKTGIIIPPKNIELIAEASIKLLKNQNLRKKMGENGYKKLKKEFSWDLVCKKTLKVYRKALNDK